MLWLVISDTHLKGEDGLPVEVVKELSRVEGVIHCGDFVREGLYHFLSREKP
ncbi:MAG: metallophosphoesterase family protein, partial [bacterium]